MRKYQVITTTIHGDHARVLIREGFDNYADARRRLTQAKRTDANYVSNHTRFESELIKTS